MKRSIIGTVFLSIISSSNASLITDGFPHDYILKEDSSWSGFDNVEFIKRTRNCGVSMSADGNSVNVSHKFYTCGRIIADADTGLPLLSEFTPDGAFDISFNAVNTTPSIGYNNYYMATYMPGIFSWRYHRESSDYLWTPAGTIGINWRKNNNYRIAYDAGDWNVFVNNSLVLDVKDSPLNETIVTDWRIDVNHARIKLGNVSVSSYEEGGSRVSVPEPDMLAIFSLGLLGLVGAFRRR